MLFNVFVINVQFNANLNMNTMHVKAARTLWFPQKAKIRFRLNNDRLELDLHWPQIEMDII